MSDSELGHVPLTRYGRWKVPEVVKLKTVAQLVREGAEHEARERDLSVDPHTTTGSNQRLPNSKGDWGYLPSGFWWRVPDVENSNHPSLYLVTTPKKEP